MGTTAIKPETLVDYINEKKPKGATHYTLNSSTYEWSYFKRGRDDFYIYSELVGDWLVTREEFFTLASPLPK